MRRKEKVDECEQNLERSTERTLGGYGEREGEKYANARVHLSRHHAHVFPGSFRTHCRGRIEYPHPPASTLPSANTHASKYTLTHTYSCVRVR